MNDTAVIHHGPPESTEVMGTLRGKVGMWLTLGATRETLVWITCGLGAGATILLVFGFRRVRRSEISAKARLEKMEQEYADLLERSDAGARSGS